MSLATHILYSGGARLDIESQLNNGVRGIEYDIHDNDYSLIGDYQIGHYHPGGEVDHSGLNPSSNRLNDWLERIASWSLHHPNHAPITLVLDLKDNLTDNASFEEGNLSALNHAVQAAFGGSLYAANGAPLPDISQLKGKTICVLSGDAQTRALYKRDKGHNPSVAVNEQGQVLSVHDSGTGHLWYWSGQQQPDGSISWLRHGKYGTGTDPAVALNNAGKFVTVHQSENNDTLWLHTGTLNTQGVPNFNDSVQYDSGVAPTIRFIDKDTDELIERHQSANTGLVWSWEISLSGIGLQATWINNHQTSLPLFDSEQDDSVLVMTGGHSWAGSDTLLIKTESWSGSNTLPQSSRGSVRRFQ